MKITIEGNTVDGSARSTLNIVLSGARGPAGEPSPLGVPYTGATQDVNLGEFGLLTGNVEFDTTPTNAPTGAGSMSWNDTDGTVNLVLKGGNVISKLGETQHIRAYNNTGTAIARGKVVYVSGAQGQRLTVALADADTEILSKDTIGFTAESIADGAEGFVIIAGVLSNMNTSGMADGATLYLSQNAGEYTTTAPTDPAHLVILGFIVNGGSGGAGSIYVKVDNGYELEELHNVSDSAKTTPVGADALLLRDSENNNIWKRLTWTNALAGVKTHMDTFKGVAGGYASLDGSGKIPSTELPSYVDDVVEAANFAALPVTGETGKIYVTLDNNKCYRWSGSVYVEVSQGIDTLTTTGTSGAATLVGSTLNIPQYQSVLTNPVTGTGTAGQVSYWSGTNTVTGSQDFTWNDTIKILSFSNGGTLINEIRISSVNSNTMMGRLAGSSASLSGGSNSFFGQNSGSANTTGNGNSAFGLRSGNNNTTGSGNVFFGSQSGRYISDGSNLTISNNSVFVGFDTRAAADNQTNQTVIGYAAIGLGSNTTVIGNSSTTLTWLGGSTSIGTTTNSARLHVRGSGTTSATTALLVENSGASALFKITDDGTLIFGNSTQATRIFSFVTNYNSPSVDGRNIQLFSSVTTQGSSLGAFYFTGLDFIHTANNQIFVNISKGFAPTSGTATFANIVSSPTINQTGGANGITRGLYVNPTLTAAADWRSVEFSNNTGWGLYGAGTANNYLGGRLALNSTSLTNVTLRNSIAISGSTSSYGYFSDGSIQSGVTSTASYFHISPQTQNASFTLTNLNGYYVENPNIGASSTVTNVYGFYGNIASGTGRWNLYMNGTAANYLAGNTSIGTTTSSGRLTVRGSGTTSATNGLLIEDSAGTDTFTIRDDGGYAFKGGTVGLAQTGYTTFTNLTTDRTCDANATTVEELADILGTLIEDLKTKGIISA